MKFFYWCIVVICLFGALEMNAQTKGAKENSTPKDFMMKQPAKKNITTKVDKKTTANKKENTLDKPKSLTTNKQNRSGTGVNDIKDKKATSGTENFSIIKPSKKNRSQKKSAVKSNG